MEVGKNPKNINLLQLYDFLKTCKPSIKHVQININKSSTTLLINNHTYIPQRFTFNQYGPIVKMLKALSIPHTINIYNPKVQSFILKQVNPSNGRWEIVSFCDAIYKLSFVSTKFISLESLE